jgi:hypothetical protein
MLKIRVEPPKHKLLLIQLSQLFCLTLTHQEDLNKRNCADQSVERGGLHKRFEGLFYV